MNTEITDKKKIKGWVLFDGDCRICTRLARRFERSLGCRGFKVLPLQTPWVRAKLGLPDSELLFQMRLLLPDGSSFGGADVLIEIGRSYWCFWPFSQMARIPVIRKLLHCSYRWVASRRSCARERCNKENQ